MKVRVKSLFNVLLDYAVEYEIVERNYARTFSVSEDVAKEVENNREGHIPFTNDEILLLWSNVDTIAYVDLVLIQCYSGWRPQELGLIRMEDVDLENWTFQGGMKTDAGTNRVVPIHTRIRPLVKARYEEAQALGSEYLFNNVGKRTKGINLTYGKYKNHFNRIVRELNLNPGHKPHDGRVHFVTMAKKWKVDEYAIKYIIGHAIPDITEKVYTKRGNDWLMEEIEK